MGRNGRGARVIPTEESKTAPSNQSAAVFTPVVPIDHVADEPESGAFWPALADASASSHADVQGYLHIYGVSAASERLRVLGAIMSAL